MRQIQLRLVLPATRLWHARDTAVTRSNTHTHTGSARALYKINKMKICCFRPLCSVTRLRPYPCPYPHPYPWPCPCRTPSPTTIALPLLAPAWTSQTAREVMGKLTFFSFFCSPLDSCTENSVHAARKQWDIWYMNQSGWSKVVWQVVGCAKEL